ncbi:MAG: hypothetical protein KJZ91_05850 [Myxococcales bacterium]|nr:hypothetical protein [Myxococcales bacterium]
MADADDVRANPGFALGELARALTTAEEHPDPAARARARARIDRWRQVFEGMVSGALEVGSRTPTAAPAWATLEVAHGGFATGRLRAGGELLDHERALLARLGVAADAPARGALNAWYLSEAGQAELRARLDDGAYRVEVPEEAALLVVAWLVAHDGADEARAILEQLGPWLGQLRFYPQPGAPAATGGDGDVDRGDRDGGARAGERAAGEAAAVADAVCLQPVAATIAQLEAVRERGRRLAEREAATVWAPLVDRMVALFAETVVDGWPCQRYPAGWAERAGALDDEVSARRAEPHRCRRRVDHPRSNLARLHALLGRAVADPASLTGRHVGELRGILARIERARGGPGSPRLEALRAAQRRRVARPTRAEAARVVAARLAAVPGDRGLTTLAGLFADVTAAEAAAHGLPAGAALAPRTERAELAELAELADGTPSASGPAGPRARADRAAGLRAIVRRSLEAPVERLVDAGVIGSAEVLAGVVPQLTAPVVAAGVRDPALRRVLVALYRAFRRRRSLLLLRLAHQVRLRELPWAEAITGARVDDAATRVAARRALGRVVDVAVCAWPATPLPNKLLQEVRALAERAGLALPLVDELAADIFTGELSETFLRAARQAARFLAGTLYATYYDLPVARLAALDDAAPSRWGTPISPGLMSLCMERAGATSPFGRPAHNGTILEQAQILTTHNLAALVGGLGLSPRIAARLPALARRAWDEVTRVLQTPRPRRVHQLRAIRAAAAAWRQMIFFASLLPAPAQRELVTWAGERLAAAPVAFRGRFGPAYAGLCLAAAGMSPGAHTAPEARVFVGWSTEPHWLLA